tara:strand:- start:811 stop:1200 length:390 start_codon:yes stop_codon:yes gene_type:complete
MNNTTTVNSKIKELTKEHGCFFAFSKEQFKANEQPGQGYVHLYGGLYAPSSKYKIVLDEMIKIQENQVNQDKETNSIKDIIFRECANLELQYGCINDIIEHLSDYEIDLATMRKHYNEYINYCIDTDNI